MVKELCSDNMFPINLTSTFLVHISLNVPLRPRTGLDAMSSSISLNSSSISFSLRIFFSTFSALLYFPLFTSHLDREMIIMLIKESSVNVQSIKYNACAHHMHKAIYAHVHSYVI